VEARDNPWAPQGSRGILVEMRNHPAGPERLRAVVRAQATIEEATGAEMLAR
jgi:hypothetical protein